jgi:hypothetical protein
LDKKESIQDFLEKVRLAYIEDQQAKGIRASGKSAQSLRVSAKKDTGFLYGASYFKYQKEGRKPGGFPPIEKIMEWIRQKNIDADISDKSLAFLIARKIARLGTDIHLKKRPGLSVEEKIKELKDQLVRNIINAGKTELIETVKEKVTTALNNK